MSKIIEFLSESNRWKHLLGGFLVGAVTCSPLYAVYTATIAASCLEGKDKAWGGEWEWADWLMTVAGGAVAAGVVAIIRLAV